MFYAQSTAKGHIKAKLNVFLPQVHILIYYLIHIPPVQTFGEIGGDIKLNEPGRLSRLENPVSRHSMQSYIRTYSVQA